MIERFTEYMQLPVARVDAADMFLHALSGVSEPKDKERIAGQLMNQVLLRQLAEEPDIKTVITGTNLNDLFFGGYEDQTAFGTVQICEPISGLFKEEVRRLAAVLELPSAFTSRQPFPASGLALRVFGSLTEERLKLLRDADAIFVEEIRQSGQDRRLWQYYATLIDSPDAPGSYAVCLRATQSAAGGANAARLSFDVLEQVSERIRTELPAVTRIVYDLTPSAHYGELE